MFDDLKKIREKISKRVNSYSSEDIILQSNVSEAMNNIINNREIFNWQKNDAVVINSITYPMVRNVSFNLEKYGVEIIVVDFNAKNLSSDEKIIGKNYIQK